MGGINCHLPQPTRPIVTMTDLRNAGTEYAKVVKNIFDFSAYFSLANSNIEKAMLNEINNKEEAKSYCYEAIDQFKKAMNISQSTHLLLNKFIKEIPVLENQGTDYTSEMQLKKMSQLLLRAAKNQQKLIQAYENSDIEKHILSGDLNRTIRNNSVTEYTEKLAQDLADIMIDLKNHSMYDRAETNILNKAAV
ncbi:hypothetical protein [Lactobacillus apis]|uniref:hypothetical protein n=1 Tax=Lactobacillus apis TaxID=303541 RepID=UPI00242C0F0E|nr:hypothetical protein [Lactobacillus apis]